MTAPHVKDLFTIQCLRTLNMFRSTADEQLQLSYCYNQLRRTSDVRSFNFRKKKAFGIHLTESTHHIKVPLEFWVVFFDNENIRQQKYLVKKETERDF